MEIVESIVWGAALLCWDAVTSLPLRGTGYFWGMADFWCRREKCEFFEYTEARRFLGRCATGSATGFTARPTGREGLLAGSMRYRG